MHNGWGTSLLCLLARSSTAHLCPLPTSTPAAGPYTSYDLNTLLRNTSGSRQNITLSLKDELQGETSRIAGKDRSIQEKAAVHGLCMHPVRARCGAFAACHTKLCSRMHHSQQFSLRHVATVACNSPPAPCTLCEPVSRPATPCCPASIATPAVAEAIVQLLPLDFVEGHHFSIGSKEGDGPGLDAGKWRTLFASCAQQRAGVA